MICQWQPIETAPKDGTEVIGWNGDSVDIIHWEVNPAWIDEPCWEDRDCEMPRPSHWLPIPPAPEL